jgi:hypothetical protein
MHRLCSTVYSKSTLLSSKERGDEIFTTDFELDLVPGENDSTHLLCDCSITPQSTWWIIFFGKKSENC